MNRTAAIAFVAARGARKVRNMARTADLTYRGAITWTNRMPLRYHVAATVVARYPELVAVSS